MERAADLLYRLLYGGVLSRLPERIAVPLGQWALRLLPLDRLPIFRNDDPRLAITLGGVRLPNPLILSSMYYDTTILRRAMGLGFGAVTAKSITRKPRPGHPQPNLVRVTTPEGPGLVNCNGFHNPGLITDDLVEYVYTSAHQSNGRYPASALLSDYLVLDIHEPFARLQVPVIAVWGREGELSPSEASSAFKRVNPRIEVRILDKSRSHLQEEQPVNFNNLVREFATAGVK